MSQLEIKNLKVSYHIDSKEILALQGVNLSFVNGKITAIIGPSGCGKTTLLRTICGFLDYEGIILADGVDYSSIDYKKRNLSYVDQSITLNPNIDIYNNIASSLIINKVKRMEIDRRIKAITTHLGINKYLSLFPPQLSAGQCQLSLLAKAIIKEPDLLLLDEAFSSLDQDSKKRFFALINEQQKVKPMTVLFVTHNVDEIHEIADYVAIMEKGQINKLISREDKMFTSLKEIMENNSGENNEPQCFTDK